MNKVEIWIWAFQNGPRLNQIHGTGVHGPRFSGQKNVISVPFWVCWALCVYVKQTQGLDLDLDLDMGISFV